MLIIKTRTKSYHFRTPDKMLKTRTARVKYGSLANLDEVAALFIKLFN